MQLPTKRKLFPLFALMFIMGAFLFSGIAYAATGTENQTLSVDDVWLTGDTLHIAVTDRHGGESRTLELNLRDYARPGDEFVTIQATDSSGRTSNAIQFRNPFYTVDSGELATDNEGDGNSASETAIPDANNSAGGGSPLTPDGTGTVLDNVTDEDGKEFFTVSTEDGNVFYLIVDRQRHTDNVYLLNAVTEYDLASLAQPGDGRNTSAVPEPPAPAPPASEPEPTPEPTPEPEPEPERDRGSAGMLAFVAIVVIVCGGIGYYVKIVRPKQNAEYDEAFDDFDDDTEADLAEDGKVGDEE